MDRSTCVQCMESCGLSQMALFTCVSSAQDHVSRGTCFCFPLVNPVYGVTWARADKFVPTCVQCSRVMWAGENGLSSFRCIECHASWGLRQTILLRTDDMGQTEHTVLSICYVSSTWGYVSWRSCTQTGSCGLGVDRLCDMESNGQETARQYIHMMLWQGPSRALCVVTSTNVAELVTFLILKEFLEVQGGLTQCCHEGHGE